MLVANVPDPEAIHKRNQLRNLDKLLGELETMNLREMGDLSNSLCDRLRHAGVVFRDGAPASEIIDLVFRVQETYLNPLPTPVTRRRSAA